MRKEPITSKRELKKHKNDIFRIIGILENNALEVGDTILEDISYFKEFIKYDLPSCDILGGRDLLEYFDLISSTFSPFKK